MQQEVKDELSNLIYLHLMYKYPELSDKYEYLINLIVNNIPQHIYNAYLPNIEIQDPLSPFINDLINNCLQINANITERLIMNNLKIKFYFNSLN